jgi:hypothetical protein
MEPSEELKEHAEHAREPFDKRVAATELLLQQEWAFYQAKSIRRYDSEITRDLLGSLNTANAAKQFEAYASNSNRYRKEGDEISKEATNLEKESHLKGYGTVVANGFAGIVTACTTALIHA